MTELHSNQTVSHKHEFIHSEFSDYWLCKICLKSESQLTERRNRNEG